MKKVIIILLITVASFNASAEIYSYLMFTKTDGMTLTCPVEGLKLTYDSNNVYISHAEGEEEIALSSLTCMSFSNDNPQDTSLKGDVNIDGELNIADVNAVIAAILSGQDSYEGRVDVNGDGEVNIADINAVIALILSN